MVSLDSITLFLHLEGEIGGFATKEPKDRKGKIDRKKAAGRWGEGEGTLPAKHAKYAKRRTGLLSANFVYRHELMVAYMGRYADCSRGIAEPWRDGAATQSREGSRKGRQDRNGFQSAQWRRPVAEASRQ